MSNKAETYEKDVVINDQIVHIRAITDADTGVEKLSDAKLNELVDINYDTKMAFVAVLKKLGVEQELVGVARYVTDEYDHCKAELITAEGWLEHGLGQQLTKTLIDFAKAQGKELFYLVDLSDNTAMRIVAKDLGLDSQRDPSDANLMRHELTL